ncbi:STAS domain-containing protein [Bizionia argentinensis JUB59]|uniref:STAS domain-containing protein n=1 Tax=Bizionia argentinensis JUB59 TaxID=1046627 RepID=G2EAI5_9FLAO|nr:STAS domain-containing protein [Bizionia argentinensis]EGV44544.2 STAS domain-containing protein [Bizionia argentinensis JUB59]
MSLIISSSKNFFDIKGTLDRNSVSMFQKEFENVFEKLQSVTINIEGLKSIDKLGVTALAKLHNEALLKKTKLSIIGFGCKELYDDFKTFDAA